MSSGDYCVMILQIYKSWDKNLSQTAYSLDVNKFGVYLNVCI